MKTLPGILIKRTYKESYYVFRAYKPASYYMDIFVSPLATVIAKFTAFLAGSVLAVLILLTGTYLTFHSSLSLTEPM